MRAHPAPSASERRPTWAAAGAALLFSAAAWTADTPPTSPGSEPGELQEFVITAPEPRYVASTRRDRIGRIWTPVIINGQGPVRLALDTGSPSSAIRAEVVARLGIVADEADNVRVRGVRGLFLFSSFRVILLVFV